MKIEELLKRYETLCVSFSEEEKSEFAERLDSLGFSIPENFRSPAIIHRDKSLSFITGFVSGMYFSQPAWKLKMRRVIKTDYSKLSPEDTNSGWYSSRERL